MNEIVNCPCACKCWGDCYSVDFDEDDICGECECHGTGLEDNTHNDQEE